MVPVVMAIENGPMPQPEPRSKPPAVPVMLSRRLTFSVAAPVIGLIVPVPVLSPRLSSHWLRLITDVDLPTARSLVDSLTNDVVVTDRRLEELVGRPPLSFRAAAELALTERIRAHAEV